MTPELFSKENQKFKKLHINISKEGVACNELLYMLCGTVNFIFDTSNGLAELEVTAANNEGWIVIFRGDYPHGGTFSHHLKQLAVVIGPDQWEGKCIE